MPQWRKLHTKITESLDVNDMPDDFHRLLWMLLPLIVCREGRGLDNPAWVKAKAMPLRDDVRRERVEEAMAWFAQRGMIVRYQVAGRGYFQIAKFHEYQGSTSREAESNYPGPEQADVPQIAAGSNDALASNSRASQELVTSASCTDADADADTDAEVEERAAGDDGIEATQGTRLSPRTHRDASLADDVGEKMDSRKRGTSNVKRETSNVKRETPGGKRETSGAGSQTSRGAGKRPPAKKSRVPPGVAEFRRQAHRYPAKSWYADIDRVVGGDVQDVDFWGRVVHAWVGCGWNPTNVKGMLEFFGRRELPGQGMGKRPPSGGTERVDEAQIGSIVDAAFEAFEIGVGGA